MIFSTVELLLCFKSLWPFLCWCTKGQNGHKYSHAGLVHPRIDKKAPMNWQLLRFNVLFDSGLQTIKWPNHLQAWIHYLAGAKSKQYNYFVSSVKDNLCTAFTIKSVVASKNHLLAQISAPVKSTEIDK